MGRGLVSQRPDWRIVRIDIAAGVTVGVLLVPQAMAYAGLAGMPPVTGLYTALGALVLYAPFGSSPYVSAGPSAVTALLVAAALAPLNHNSPADYVALASVLALLVGVVRIALAALRAGRLINLVSQPVLTGFTAGAGVIIAVSQLGNLLGTDVTQATQVGPALAAVWSGLPGITPPALWLGVGSLFVLLAVRRWAPAFPAPLAVVVVTAALVALTDVKIPVVGEVPGGLPLPILHLVGPATFRALVPGAVVLALVGYVEGVSVAKALAIRQRRRVDPDAELLAHGVASLAAGLLGGFPNGGSFSRTALAHHAGARTRAAGLVSAVVVAITLLVAAPALAVIPNAVLAAVVLYAVSGLFDVEGARHAFGVSAEDGAAVVIAFVVTLVFGVRDGFLLAVGADLLLYLYRGTHPSVTELGRVAGSGKYRDVSRWEHIVADPRVVVLRIGAGLTFLNADSVSDRVAEVLTSRPQVDAVVLDLSGVSRIDATGLYVLTGLLERADDGAFRLELAMLRGPARDALIVGGVWGRAEDRIHPNVRSAVQAAITSNRASATNC